MKINIHRYCNKVALSLGGQPTVYVEQELAAALAAALTEAVTDISARGFVDSTFEARELVEVVAGNPASKLTANKSEALKAKLRRHVTGSGKEPVVNIQAPITTDNQKRQAYLDWTNNFLSIEVFAEHYGITVEAAGKVIEEGRILNLPWHVVAVSTNAGAFGHKSVLVIREDGEGRELLLQAYGTAKLPVRGDILEVLPQSEVQPRKLPSTTPAKARKIISQLK